MLNAKYVAGISISSDKLIPKTRIDSDSDFLKYGLSDLFPSRIISTISCNLFVFDYLIEPIQSSRGINDSIHLRYT